MQAYTSHLRDFSLITIINSTAVIYMYDNCSVPCVVSDIDECETGTHNCGAELECQNTAGSFRCRPRVQCGVGFIQDALGSCIGETAKLQKHQSQGRHALIYLRGGSEGGVCSSCLSCDTQQPCDPGPQSWS